MALPTTYEHPDPLHNLAPCLTFHLPFSLPLLRRIQFSQSCPHARILATFPPDAQHEPFQDPNVAFAAAWVDRTRAPETECWVFSSYESLASQHVEVSVSSSSDGPAWPDESVKHRARSHLLSVFRAIASGDTSSGDPLLIVGALNDCLLPLFVPEQGYDDDIASPVLTRDINEARRMVSDRAAARRRRRTSSSSAVERYDGVICGMSIPYIKYIIPPPHQPAAAITPASTKTHTQTQTQSPFALNPALPESYSYTRLTTPEHFALVRSRTAIPRTDRSLSAMRNVGITHTSNVTTQNTQQQEAVVVVSWAFLSPDGSIASLHVEPEHRGRGLAKIVWRALALDELCQDRSVVEGPSFRAVPLTTTTPPPSKAGPGEPPRSTTESVTMSGFTHADIAASNAASAGVARGVSGRAGWAVRWTGLDLERVLQVLEVDGQATSGS